MEKISTELAALNMQGDLGNYELIRTHNEYRLRLKPTFTLEINCNDIRFNVEFRRLRLIEHEFEELKTRSKIDVLKLVLVDRADLLESQEVVDALHKAYFDSFYTSKLN